MQCRNLRQNGSIISSILSEDTVLSSSFIRNIIFEIVADIEIGLESSDMIVPLSIVLNKVFGCDFLVTLSRRDESLRGNSEGTQRALKISVIPSEPKILRLVSSPRMKISRI